MNERINYLESFVNTGGEWESSESASKAQDHGGTIGSGAARFWAEVDWELAFGLSFCLSLPFCDLLDFLTVVLAAGSSFSISTKRMEADDFWVCLCDSHASRPSRR